MKTSTVRRTGYLLLALLFSAMCLAEGATEEQKTDWRRPRSTERKNDRQHMTRSQLERRDIRDKAVLNAMRNVPRHWFVPENRQRAAYADRPLPIGHGQTISQPYIVALMTQLLRLKSTHSVLEIGTGSGYQAAVLNELTPNVFTIEIIRELAGPAARRLKEHGYDRMTVKTGDGYYGWEEHAPFDAIIVTAAATHIPPPLLKQLKHGGRMVIPVGAAFRVQQLMLVEKDDNGKVSSRVIAAVRFVPLTGGRKKNE